MEKAVKIYLAINACIWLPYAAVCTVYPELLAVLGVFEQSSWVAAVEVRAMYGGAQLAIGLFALIALLRPRHSSSALLFLTLLFAGLVLMAPTLATTGRYPFAQHCVAWQAVIAALYFGPHLSQLIAKPTGLQFFPLLLLGYAVFQARLFWLETHRHSCTAGAPPTVSKSEPTVATKSGC